MKSIKFIVLVVVSQFVMAQKKVNVETYNKVIISPHIETTFVQGNQESVTIIKNTTTHNKVNIEVNSGTLRVYLDGAKETTKHKKVVKNGITTKVPIYKGKVLTILVTYKNLDELSLRGEQQTICKSLLENEIFKLKIYGESKVILNAVKIEKFNANIYGESELIIKKGLINTQNITAYGESEINLLEVENKVSKLKAYGEAQFYIQATDKIKFTAYGEAKLQYKGSAIISKGISFGDSEISQIN